MAKKGKINLVFCIDESGSMYSSVNDVVGGFKKTIDEQKAQQEGECVVSLYKFASEVTEVFVGKNLDEIETLEYSPSGVTKLFDGVGTAIDNVGKWLNSMDEDEKPSKTLVVIMTDGEENSSKEYSGDRVREMIKHQTEKYSWDFLYLGSDLTDSKDSKTLGTAYRAFTSKKKFVNNYNIISASANAWRSTSNMDLNEANTMFDTVLRCATSEVTAEYKADTGIDLT